MSHDSRRHGGLEAAPLAQIDRWIRRTRAIRSECIDGSRKALQNGGTGMSLGTVVRFAIFSSNQRISEHAVSNSQVHHKSNPTFQTEFGHQTGLLSLSSLVGEKPYHCRQKPRPASSSQVNSETSINNRLKISVSSLWSKIEWHLSRSKPVQ